jgi:hypothetical protein
MTAGGTILFPAKQRPKREYSAHATVSPIEGELNLQPAGCAEKRLGIRRRTALSRHEKRKHRAPEKEMNMKSRMDLQSFLRILGMSLGVGLVHQFAPMLAHQAEAEIADVFARSRIRSANIRRTQRYLPLRAN